MSPYGFFFFFFFWFLFFCFFVLLIGFLIAVVKLSTFKSFSVFIFSGRAVQFMAGVMLIMSYVIMSM